MVRVIPFHGMISAVDGRAKTFTIAGKDKSRVFKISDQTTITKTGAPATMKDVVEKEEVRGSYWKEADHTCIARTVKVGPPTAQEKAADDARKAKRAEKSGQSRGRRICFSRGLDDAGTFCFSQAITNLLTRRPAPGSPAAGLFVFRAWLAWPPNDDRLAAMQARALKTKRPAAGEPRASLRVDGLVMA